MQIGNALVPVDFHVLDIKLNGNFSLLLRRVIYHVFYPFLAMLYAVVKNGYDELNIQNV